jgi:hypothetical protein
MIDHSAEKNLLRAAIRQILAGEECGLGSVGPLNWHHLLWLGRQHKALLFLHRASNGAGVAHGLPPEIAAQLQLFHEAHQLRSLARAREACRLQDEFDRHGIAVIPTNGWMAARCAGLPPDVVEAGSDLQCVVHAEDLTRSISVVTAAGHPVGSNPEKLVISGRSPVKFLRAFGGHPAAHRFWEQASMFSLGGRAFRRLATKHWLLLRTPGETAPGQIRLAHAAEIVSLARQIPGTEWDEVLTEAAGFGLESALAGGVAACHRTLGLPPPPGTEASGNPTPVARPDDDHASMPPSIAAPYLPTPSAVVLRMLELAGVHLGDLVCDLGCGDGRIAIEAARQFGARGFGIDRDPARVTEAITRATALGLQDRVRFAEGDLFSADIRDATVVTCYLLPHFQPALREKLRREARPGTRIISHEFVFPDWPPERTVLLRTGPLTVSQLYLWRII